MEHEYNGDMFMKREHAETHWNKQEGYLQQKKEKRWFHGRGSKKDDRVLWSIF